MKKTKKETIENLSDDELAQATNGDKLVVIGDDVQEYD